jgi:hypothetical protein
MTREEAQAIYRADEETVVRVLVELSARVDQLTADFAILKAENIALRERVRTLEGQLAKDSHNSHKPPSSDGLNQTTKQGTTVPRNPPLRGTEKHFEATADIDHLLTAQNAVATARSADLQGLPDTQKVFLLARYNRIVDEGYSENPRAEPPSAPKRRGRRKQSKALNLLDRFRDHSPSILAFLHDFDVPFDNNQSEREFLQHGQTGRLLGLQSGRS